MSLGRTARTSLSRHLAPRGADRRGLRLMRDWTVERTFPATIGTHATNHPHIRFGHAWGCDPRALVRPDVCRPDIVARRASFLNPSERYKSPAPCTMQKDPAAPRRVKFGRRRHKSPTCRPMDHATIREYGATSGRCRSLRMRARIVWTTGQLAARSEVAATGRSVFQNSAFWQPSGTSDACWSPPPFPEDERVRLINFPIEKIIIAGPCMDLGPADLTVETARMLVWMLLSCRGVRQPAIGTAKKFGRPYVACHPANMRRTEH